ncbi:ubiquinol-cytochrome c reductase iron-sulfur subunit [Bartonella sp. JB63]|nr:ubiquinol-cytochrome c reductase iron-sulfur subunit [Bartonella sp. JB15]AQX28872.1 ubiquinol-cytochrome c reductase iron-sulfur subunit [Bartonella sp. JB63]
MGVGTVTWPFISQLHPDQAVLSAASIEVDLSDIEEDMSVTVK